jgi:hypothetical protein
VAVAGRPSQEREEALRGAAECGRRFRSGGAGVRRAMREELLRAGYVESNRAAEQLERALAQRDYLIQRQLGLLRCVSGAGFLSVERGVFVSWGGQICDASHARGRLGFADVCVRRL